MRSVVVFLVVAAVAIAAAWGLSGITGTVSATVGETVFEMSTPVAIFLICVLATFLALLLRFLVGVRRTPGRVRFWQAGRRRAAGDRAVTQALVALAAGDGGGARREAGRARKLLGDQPLTLLLAAQSARQAGREDEAAALFRTLADRRDASFLGLRGLLRMEVAQGRWQQASALAQEAGQVQPSAAWLREERAFLAVRTGQWRDALRLAGPGAPRAAYAAAAAEAEKDPREARRLAKEAWEADSTLVPAALAYARSLRAAGKERAAMGVLGRTWETVPHPDLAALALEPVKGALERVQAAESLVAGARGAAESYLLLARTSLEAGLIPKARRYLESARGAGGDQRRTWLLAADIAEAEGDRNAVTEALRRAAQAGPDPAWQCTACSAVQPDWAPVCPACSTPGRIAWKRPDQPLALAAQDPARLTHARADTEQLA